MKSLLFVFSFLCLLGTSSAQDPVISFNQLYSGFSLAVDIANAGDGSDRLFIVEKTGRIKIIKNGSILSTPFINLDPRVSSSASERGLLGLAFHPLYASNGKFYVYYINNSNNTVVSEFNVSSGNPDIADDTSETILFTTTQPYNNHNGGDLNFGPLDGYLYIALGDGGSGGDPGCRSQDGNTYLGKILRIDVDNIPMGSSYGIPASNPFISNPAVLDEIWATGLRNPWRISFDPLNGNLWIADVGQNALEEVDFQLGTSSGGENYGWSVKEGTNCFKEGDCNSSYPGCSDPNYIDPIFEYGHNTETGGYSITGGYVYRGCRYTKLYGHYIAADFVTRNCWLINESGNVIQTTDSPADVTTFGVDEAGEMYLATIDGKIFHVEEDSYPENLLLTTADNPLSGIYNASNSITLQSGVILSSVDSVLLIAPSIRISEDINVPSNRTLLLSKGACID